MAEISFWALMAVLTWNKAACSASLPVLPDGRFLFFSFAAPPNSPFNITPARIVPRGFHWFPVHGRNSYAIAISREVIEKQIKT
jgi:hypothetical protein